MKYAQHKIVKYSKHAKIFHVISYINYVLRVCEVNLCWHEDVENSEFKFCCAIHVYSQLFSSYPPQESFVKLAN